MLIKANGTYALKPIKEAPSGRSIVYVSGALGTATVTISYKDSADVVVPFTDGAVTAGDQYKIEHGIGVDLLLVVTGADGATAIVTETARLL